MQECYVNIWNHSGNYKLQLAAPMTWMTSIVRNRCLDWLRRPRKEDATDDDAVFDAVIRQYGVLRARNEELAVLAERNLRAREELLSIVAHDVRGPLGVITLARGLLPMSMEGHAA